MVETKTDYKLQGKKNRKSGADFERRVRADLNSKGWIVDKWTNNVELPKKECVGKYIGCGKKFDEFKYKCGTYHNESGYDYTTLCDACKMGKLVKAKNKWAGPNRPMMMGAGFCDFIAFKLVPDVLVNTPTTPTFKVNHLYEVIGVECKVNGYLKPEEKEKCKWLLDNYIFSKILIASKTKEGRKIVINYKEFK